MPPYGFWHRNQHVVCIVDMWEKGHRRPPGVTSPDQGSTYISTITKSPRWKTFSYLISGFSAGSGLHKSSFLGGRISKSCAGRGNYLLAHDSNCFCIIVCITFWTCGPVINKWKIFVSKWLVPWRGATDLKSGGCSDSLVFLVGKLSA